MDDRNTSVQDIEDHPENEAEVEENQKKLKYPKSIFFIISNEFCERFCFYGMRTILTYYLRNKLNYDDNMTTVIYHVFTMLVYFFPLLGAIVADSWLGKFRTIFYLSIIYAIGQFLLSLSAVPPIGLPPREFTLVGLLLIAVGTGGIKSCVAAFGGDQFVLPQQEQYLSTFFSLFYFSINSGSLISSYLTPVLRSDVMCFGENTCYSLAFFVPSVLMALSIVIFLVGKPLYKMEKPSDNVVLNVVKCVSRAIHNKATSKGEKREYWLDYADDKYSRSLIKDIKSTLQVLKLFIPIPIFWALYDQQGSRWTIQANRMNGEIGSFLIQADQMQVVNPLLVLAFIPFFEACIYPLLGKIGLNTPLKKLTIGGLLASSSFVVSALIELELEKTDPILPSEGLAQMRIFNTLNCPVHLNVNGTMDVNLKNLDMWVERYIDAKGNISLNYMADFTQCHDKAMTKLNSTVQGTINLSEAKATSVVVKPDGLSYQYIDTVGKSKSGNPLVRGLFYVDPSSVNNETIHLKIVKNDYVAHSFTINTSDFQDTGTLVEILPGTYDIRINNDRVKKDVALKVGGVYTIVGSKIAEQNATVNVITVTDPNSLHIFWLIPQYVIITMGEVMFSVTGLEFAFTESPPSMKSLLQAYWQLTVAFGNLIVVIVAEASFFSRQMYEFLLFAGLMFLDIIVFGILAKFFKSGKNEEDAVEDISLDSKNGTANKSYTDDEK